ncbi:MAG: hypothetical protein IPL35_17855, partial [Sphingobacteriales bacterium]|nr:hypothetical protein [Sphingobacteriales bacterium]
LLGGKIRCTQKYTIENTIGGSGYDELLSVQQTTDRSYTLGVQILLFQAIKPKASQGQSSYWVVKLDVSGNIQYLRRNYDWGAVIGII